ncbi:nucleoid-associated protein [Ferrimonas marina]|uniref:Nucleoid-associated protein n=1 Tax=Ferrimonas marina TaxID=299255 RepID=A0A1M5TLY1_9GAMM|nr:nucleoid-associated protein [Ferrimonas marina]SHH51825.1 nucleoid-associated protein [Ferrimonas marina]
MKTHNAVIHTLNQEPDGQITCRLKTQTLPKDDTTEALCLQVAQILHSKPRKAYGMLTAEEDVNPFLQTFQAWLADDVQFLEMSFDVGKRASLELAKYDLVRGGYLLVSHFTMMTTEYLLIAILSPKATLSVNQELDVMDTESLDLSNIQIACTINLNEYRANPGSNKYTLFLKGRTGLKATHFFQDFIGAVPAIDAKASSKQLVSSVNEYLSTQGLDRDEKQESRRAVLDYCSQQIKIGDDITLEGIGDELADRGLDGFISFAKGHDDTLDGGFPGDKATLNELRTFKGSGGGVTLSFDAKHLGERVRWDPLRDTLTIQGVPPNLLDQLQRLASNGTNA